jgi:hypothetical protein
MLLDLRHVFHCHEIGLDFPNQISKATHKLPVATAPLFATAPAVLGEWLTRRASRQHGQRIPSEKALQADRV